jgi:hypothetical protein
MKTSKKSEEVGAIQYYCDPVGDAYYDVLVKVIGNDISRFPTVRPVVFLGDRYEHEIQPIDVRSESRAIASGKPHESISLSDILSRLNDLKLTQRATADQTNAYLRDIAEQVQGFPRAKTPTWPTEPSAKDAKPLMYQNAPPDSYQDLPDQLSHIKMEIERSRDLLQNAVQIAVEEGEAAYTTDVWERAVWFLARNAWWALARLGRVIDSPRVLPGPDGSVDLHWDEPKYELLVNIPAQRSAWAGFYGDDRGNLTIKGKVHPDSFNCGLVLFLTEHR